MPKKTGKGRNPMVVIVKFMPMKVYRNRKKYNRKTKRGKC